MCEGHGYDEVECADIGCCKFVMVDPEHSECVSAGDDSLECESHYFQWYAFCNPPSEYVISHWSYSYEEPCHPTFGCPDPYYGYYGYDDYDYYCSSYDYSYLGYGYGDYDYGYGDYNYGD